MQRWEERKEGEEGGGGAEERNRIGQDATRAKARQDYKLLMMNGEVQGHSWISGWEQDNADVDWLLGSGFAARGSVMRYRLSPTISCGYK